MQKVIFIVVATSVKAEDQGLNLLSTPELDKLLEDGWEIIRTENVTPPEAKSRVVVQVVLQK